MLNLRRGCALGCIVLASTVFVAAEAQEIVAGMAEVRAVGDPLAYMTQVHSAAPDPREDLELRLSWEFIEVRGLGLEGGTDLLQLAVSLRPGPSVQVDDTIQNLLALTGGRLTSEDQTWTLQQESFGSVNARSILSDQGLRILIPISFHDSASEPMFTVLILGCVVAGGSVVCDEIEIAKGLEEALAARNGSTRTLSSVVLMESATQIGGPDLTGFQSLPRAGIDRCCFGNWRCQCKICGSFGGNEYPCPPLTCPQCLTASGSCTDCESLGCPECSV